MFGGVDFLPHSSLLDPVSTPAYQVARGKRGFGASIPTGGGRDDLHGTLWISSRPTGAGASHLIHGRTLKVRVQHLWPRPRVHTWVINDKIPTVVSSRTPDIVPRVGFRGFTRHKGTDGDRPAPIAALCGGAVVRRAFGVRA